MNIVHWGAGKLGLSLGVWNAHCGHNVIFVDDNGDTVRAINEGQSPIDEPQVQILLNTQEPRYLQGSAICASQGGIGYVEKGIVETAGIIFIIVPTPSLENGAFDLSYVKESCRVIGECLRQKNRYTLVVCVSTIMPGDSRKLIEILEKYSKQECGTYWGFAYSPEFVRQGSIVDDYANPDVLLIGTNDTKAARKLQEFYNTIVQNRPEKFHMSLESAEIAKIGLNASVVAKTQMANQLAWLCHHIPGANAADVLNSIGADSRIGHKYFGAGTWVGGPCFPRDTAALSASLHQHWLSQTFADAIGQFSMTQCGMLHNVIMNEVALTTQMDRDMTVGLLGLTYKSGTSLLDESQALLLAKQLRLGDEHPRVIAYDPDVAVGMSVPSLQDLVNQSDVIVVMMPKDWFLLLEGMDLSGKVLFDCWGYIGETNADKHIVIGVGNEISSD